MRRFASKFKAGFRGLSNIRGARRLRWAILAASVVFSPSALEGSKEKNPCTQGLLIKGGTHYSTPLQLTVLAGLAALTARLRRGVTLVELQRELRAFDPDTFSSWAPEGRLLIAVRKMRGQSGSVDFAPGPKPRLWSVTTIGEDILSHHFQFSALAYEHGLRLRNDVPTGPFQNVYPERGPLEKLRGAFENEFMMVFILLNLLSTDPVEALSAGTISAKIKSQFPTAGYWSGEEFSESTYPRQLGRLLARLVDLELIVAKARGDQKTLFYSLNHCSISSIYAMRAYLMSLFEWVGGKEPSPPPSTTTGSLER
jgi:hypothetical protein